MKNVFTVKKPKALLPLIFDSPHSGDHLPEDFNFACAPEYLEGTADQHVDNLFASVPDHGAALLLAKFSRCYVDPNRAIDDIDPSLVEGEWPKDNIIAEIKPTARSAAGIGLLRRLIKPGVPVYDRKLAPDEITARIQNYYIPYHEALGTLINEAHYNFGQVFHINCHSMPSNSARTKRAIGFIGNEPRTPDFVLGNRDGSTAGPDFTRALQNFLEDLGYVVSINDPFKGVELIERYSNPTAGIHSIQLEINKALYMNEVTGKKSRSKYTAFKTDIEKLIKFCADYAQGQLRELAAD